ncbi:hypothetical protein [Ferrovibrio sp.]|uniref:hypothetical protein n=1 Tax=Ferrovibrio sp. TaxID=1917215 RepID=UPI003D2CD70A
MYVVPEHVKLDPHSRWALPDRIFFACGACHILAHAFLTTHPAAGFRPLWMKPAKGFIGNHIIVARGDLAFDYHGWASLQRLLEHAHTKSNRWWPGWNAELIPVPPAILVSEIDSKEFGQRHGGKLWLREPGQFLLDPLPRAHAYIARQEALASVRELSRIA